ncbi:MAG: hypothetical protein ACJ8FT_01040 [Sphingomonas sp.]
MAGPLILLALATATPEACAVPAQERSRQLTLGYDAFDQAPAPYGWRDLNARGCTDAAVALLRAYRSANRDRLSAEQSSESAFHVGQAYAFANRPADALAAFLGVDTANATEEWRAYVAAHVAFFQRDAAALAQAQRRYASVAKTGSMRLKVIDGFLKCPDKSYVEGAHCAM